MAKIPKEITESLYPGEKVLYSVEKKKKKLYTEMKPKFLAVTDRRVIYLDQKILGRYDLIDVPYEKLEFVHFRKGKIGAKFEIKSEEGEKITLKWVKKEEAEKAIEAIRDTLNSIAVEPVSIQKKKGLLGIELFLSKPRKLAKLKKLKDVYEAGAIEMFSSLDERRKGAFVYGSYIIWLDHWNVGTINSKTITNNRCSDTWMVLNRTNNSSYVFEIRKRK